MSDNPLLTSLMEELDEHLQLTLVGERRDASLPRKAEREARAWLMRRGHANARVVAALDGAGVAVEVILPQGPPRVRAVVVRVG